MVGRRRVTLLSPVAGSLELSLSREPTVNKPPPKPDVVDYVYVLSAVALLVWSVASGLKELPVLAFLAWGTIGFMLLRLRDRGRGKRL